MSKCNECLDGDAIKKEAESKGISVKVSKVPTPRHAWSDIAICPVCEQAYSVIHIEDQPHDS